VVEERTINDVAVCCGYILDIPVRWLWLWATCLGEMFQPLVEFSIIHILQTFARKVYMPVLYPLDEAPPRSNVIVGLELKE